MSIKANEIKLKIVGLNVPPTMPPRLKNACQNALVTKILNLEKGKTFFPVFSPITLAELQTHIIPFLENNPSITTLKISKNYINDEGSTLIAACKTLHFLKMCSNFIGDEGAEALANNTSLQMIDIRYCENIGPKGNEAFSKALLLGQNQNLSELYGIAVSPEMQTVLNLNSHRIPIEECKLAAESLNSSLGNSLTNIIVAFCGRTNAELIEPSPPALVFPKPNKIVRQNSNNSRCKKKLRKHKH